MKGRVRVFEYMAWAQANQGRARYDLTGSGVADAILTLGREHEVFANWPKHLELEAACLRSERAAGTSRLAAALSRRYELDPGQIVPTIGASLGILHVLLAFVRPGDHVIVERPAYEALHRVPAMLGADVSRLERRHDEEWTVRVDRLARLITPRTRAVLLTNLHNPSGTLIPADAMVAIGELAARVGALVCVDEVYLDFHWSQAGAKPACSLVDNAVSWSSTTKAFGFSSLRAGWIVAKDPEVARAMRDAAHYLHVDIPGASALLASYVIDSADLLIDHARQHARLGLEIVRQWLSEETRVSWTEPTAGICGALKLPDLVGDLPFCQQLRERWDTQLVPGTMFEAPGFVRLGFGGELSTLRDGLRCISRALDELA